MASKEADWAMLPQLPLCLIFEKLVAVSDFLRFAAVCKEWRLVVTNKHDNNIRRWLDSSSNQLPLLMVRLAGSHPSLYSLASQSLHSSDQLYVPSNFNFRTSGSSYGWLAFTTGTEKNFLITLYNPFTRDEINDLPRLQKELSSIRVEYFVLKVILSANPCVSRQDFYVVAIYDGIGQLALLKYGQTFWTYIDFLGSYLVAHDVVFFRGLLYAVTNWCRIASIDIFGSLNMKKPEAPQPIFIIETEAQKCSSADYLVESSQGDLLVVRKFYRVDKDEVKRDFRFQVYKIVLPSDEEGAKLEEVKCLGNEALFVGDNHSMAVSVLEFPQCQPNSIYFTDDGFDDGFDNDFNQGFYGHHGPTNNGIYNLKDGTIQKHYQPQPREATYMLPPIWIIPSPNF